MSDERGPGSEPSTRFDELKKKVERATKLIAELREANYSLTVELAELHRRVESRDAERGSAALPGGSAPPSTQAAVHEELQLLRDERKIIRARVQNLLERIEKIDR